MPRVRKRARLPAPGNPNQSDCRHTGRAERAGGQYKLISKQVMELLLRIIRQTAGAHRPQGDGTGVQILPQDRQCHRMPPGDLLKPEMEAARESVKDFTTDEGDILIAAIYPITGIAFLKKKYGIENTDGEIIINIQVSIIKKNTKSEIRNPYPSVEGSSVKSKY